MAEPRVIVLQLPADPSLLRVARVTVASAAAELPFTLEDIEDLRIAVDELAAVVIEGCGPPDQLVVEVRVDQREVAVSGRIEADELPELHPVARDLLAMVAPGHELTSGDGHRVFRFTKRPQGAAS